MKYLGGKHYVWCSEHYDPTVVAAGAAAAAIAPSSCPKGIYDTLHADCHREDTHSALITGYRKTFKNLAKKWYAESTITQGQMNEIVATVKSASWRMWRPLLYIIPKSAVDVARVNPVPFPERAAYGPEWRIFDLMDNEFDIIER